MSKFFREYGFYYFHIFANIWPTSIRCSQAGRVRLCLLSLSLSLLSLSLSLSLGCCQLTAFQFVVPSWPALHLFNLMGSSVGFVPVSLPPSSLSLTLLLPAVYPLSCFFCSLVKAKVTTKVSGASLAASCCSWRCT